MSGVPRPAATVVLLRDGAEGLETFVMRRAVTMAFAPRMHVFPGGRVDDLDFRAPVHFVTGDVDALAERASTDAAGVSALYSCAVRETEEEVGVRLADRDDLGRLVVDPAQLPIIDHWVTPEFESRRYDVRFFAARVDADSMVALTTTEADEAGWVAPAWAVAEFEAGRMAMLPPTEHVMRRLSAFVLAADVLADAPGRDVAPLLPKRIPDGAGGSRWALVHDRTGEVLVDTVAMPHTRETDGRPAVEAEDEA
jgi:8-oxo-dGTP pyrophosphatase MutT (NUDIX family)